MKFILLIIITCTVSVFPQNLKQIKLFISSDIDLRKACTLALDLEHSISEQQGEPVIFVNEDEFQAVSSSGLRYEVLIDDWFAYYNSLPVLSDAEKEFFKMQSQRDFGVTGFGYGSMGGYYTFAEIEEDLDEMYQLFPNLITQKFSIGNSIEGRPIWAVKISDNPGLNENEPAVGLDALVHAREPQSMATLMYFMWYLLENYGTNPEATYLVNNREIYCIPCFNPDGYEYNRQTNPNGGGTWRKNRRNNGGGCYGIDLNRNFSYKWGYDNIGSSNNPCSDTYRGTGPFSEPEALAVSNLAIEKKYGTHFNMHTYGGYILFPWGYIDAETPDSLNYREFAQLLTSVSGYAYGTGYQLLGYPSNGSIRDWMYGEQTVKNKIYGYTIEIGNSFWPQQSQIFPIAQQNLRTMIYQSYLAGEFVQLVNPNFINEYFLPSELVLLSPEYRNTGLATAYNLHFELSSPSQYINTKTFFVELDSIEARSNVILSPSLSFLINGAAPLEEEIPIILTTLVNNEISSVDTIKIIIGYPVFIFEDDANDPAAYWTITKSPTSSPQWDSTFKTFYTPPVSYSDSKNGNYVNNATITMTLTNPIDLAGYTNPRLRFWTRFDIESNVDYGQVQVSTNNGSTWIALAGQYTEPGQGSFQPPGEPVYDGLESYWVKEDISLANYISSQFKVRFRLRTNGSNRRDGWYLDDIGVFIYTIPTGVSNDEEPVYKFSLEQNYPNPFNPTTNLKFRIPDFGLVTLKIFDVLGNEVATLINEEKPAGEYKIKFDASYLSSGIYFYELRAGSFVDMKKMILLK
jgi:carboxypeptidase T